MPHSRTWPATFLASGQSSGVPTALHRKASVSTRTQSAANGMRCNAPRTQDAGACLQETHCIVLPLIACNCSSRQSAQRLYRAVVPCATASLVACVRDAQSQSISGWTSIGSVLLFCPLNNSARRLIEARSDAGEVTCSRPELVPPHGVVHALVAVGNRVDEGGRGGVLISEMFEGCSAVFHAASVVLRRRYEGSDETMSKWKEPARKDCRRMGVGERIELQWSCASVVRLAPITKP